MAGESARRIRINLRSLICLKTAAVVLNDDVFFQLSVTGPGGETKSRRFPEADTELTPNWKGVKKNSWVFKGDTEALVLWEGDVPEGHQVDLRGTLLEFNTNMPVGIQKTLTAVGPLLGQALFKGKVGKLLGAAIGGLICSGIDYVWDGQPDSLGAFSLVVHAQDGRGIPALGLSTHCRFEGWEWNGKTYGTPSATGKTVRFLMRGDGATYGVELQVRDVTKLTAELPNGVCFLWTHAATAVHSASSTDGTASS